MSVREASLPVPTAATARGSGRVLIWASAVFLIILALRSPALVHPVLLIDDFQIVLQSLTWQSMTANFWAPANEHSMPLGRFTTWAVIALTTNLTGAARLLCFQGALATAVAAVFVYLLVRRETGQPFPALLAMAVFGVSTHYWEAVIWFAASFAVLALDMLLLGMLAAQRWRQSGRSLYLVMSAFWCGLAPGWFGTGLLAGPLCTLYLLGPDPSAESRCGWKRLRIAFVPCLGTAVSLAITLPHNAERILNLPRESLDKPAWKTFDPLVGAEYTLRAVVDDVVPGTIGVPQVVTPLPWVWLCLGLLVALTAWWWRVSPRRNLILVGIGMIVASYLLIFTARAYVEYKAVHFSRYQLLPHLGLVLIVFGAWPDRWSPALGTIPHWLAAAFLGSLLLTQLGRPPFYGANEQQLADFRRIEEVDALPPLPH